jgi:predicted dehydrogenase
MKKVGVGLVGMGFIGKTHLGVYARSRAAHLVAVCDLSERRLKRDLAAASGNIRHDTGVKVDFSNVCSTSDFRAILKDSDVEMVDLCLPTHLHKKFALAALKAGKHVLCEKPIALSSAEAKTLLAAAKKAKGHFMVAHCMRFWPEYVFARDAVKSKRYGRVLSAAFRRYSAAPGWSWQNWMLNSRRSGGVPLDLHIHDADFISVLFGMPKKVFASVPRMSSGGWISACYDYGRAMHVSAEAAWVPARDFPFSMSYLITCEKGVLDYDSSRTPALQVRLANGNVEAVELDKRDGYTREIEYFLRCVIDRRKPLLATPEDAARAVKLVEAELRSAAGRKPVSVAGR